MKHNSKKVIQIKVIEVINNYVSVLYGKTEYTLESTYNMQFWQPGETKLIFYDDFLKLRFK